MLKCVGGLIFVSLVCVSVCVLLSLNHAAISIPIHTYLQRAHHVHQARPHHVGHDPLHLSQRHLPPRGREQRRLKLLPYPLPVPGVGSHGGELGDDAARPGLLLGGVGGGQEDVRGYGLLCQQPAKAEVP